MAKNASIDIIKSRRNLSVKCVFVDDSQVK